LVFEDLPVKCITSLSNFFHIFLKRWNYEDTSIEKSLGRLPKKENHIESPRGHPKNCEENIPKDPIEDSLIEEILEECEESHVDNFFDDILEDYEEAFEDGEDPVFEGFIGEPIYDSSSDESIIIENLEMIVFYESSLDHHSYVSISPHSKTFLPSNSPIFDEYPCETLVFCNPLEDENCMKPTHVSCSYSQPPPSHFSYCHLLDLENHGRAFLEGPHDTVIILDEWPYDKDSYVSHLPLDRGMLQ